MKNLYLAGGCFWGVSHFFKQIEGVLETETDLLMVIHLTQYIKKYTQTLQVMQKLYVSHMTRPS